jgi:hypothetical protein
MLRRFHRPPTRRSKTAARRPERVRLHVESLEDRCVPASTAVVSAGVLTITGDATNVNQNITITEVVNVPAANGTYNVTITDNGSTVVNQTLSGIHSIVINSGAGSDTVTLNGTTSAGTTLTNSLSITGNGALTVNMGTGGAGFNVAGPTTITNAGGTGPLNVNITGVGTTLGTTSITSDNSACNISINNGVNIAGTLTLTGGAANDKFSLGTTGSTGVNVTGAVTVTGNTGGDNLTIGQSSVASTIGALTTTSVDSVTLSDTTVNGNVTTTTSGNQTFNAESGTIKILGSVSINATGANSSVSSSIAFTTISNFLSVTSGNGIDDITVAEATHIGGNFGFGLGGSGNGTDDVTIYENSTIGGSLVVNGTGALDFNLATSEGGSVGAFVSLNETGANSTVHATVGTSSSNTNIGSFFSVTSGGTGTSNNDSITLTNVNVGGNFGAGLGNGNLDGVNMQQTNISGNVIVNSVGNLAFAFSTASTSTGSIGGFVSLNQTGANSTDSVNVGNSSNPTVVGSFFSVTSGAGSDNVSLTNVKLGDNFGVGLSSGTDTVNLTNLTLATGAGVIVNDSGTLSSTLTNLSLVGDISYNTGSGNDTITLFGVTANNATFNTGIGNDAITINNSTFNGATTINTGSGSDSVTVQNVAGTTQFFGAVSMTMGTEADTVNLPTTTAGELAIFFSTATFDGGGDPGDTIHGVLPADTQTQFLQAGQPTVSGFATVT